MNIIAELIHGVYIVLMIIVQRINTISFDD